MGTWAAGNFDNDGALDYLGSHVQSLVKTVEECFEAGAGLDEEGESELMPTVEIITLLVEHCRAVPPPPADVKKWRKRYLKVFDDEIDDLEPSEGYKAERRAVIAATFDRLLGQATSFHDRVKAIQANKKTSRPASKGGA